MSNIKYIKFLWRNLILILIIPLILLASLFSYQFQKVLRKTLDEEDVESIIRMLSLKGLSGIFELMGSQNRRSASGNKSQNRKNIEPIN